MSRIEVDKLKILKHGNKYFKKKVAVCSLCGCEFEYENNDTETEKTYCIMTYPPTYKTYVRCPECDKRIFLNTKIFS